MNKFYLLSLIWLLGLLSNEIDGAAFKKISKTSDISKISKTSKISKISKISKKIGKRILPQKKFLNRNKIDNESSDRDSQSFSYVIDHEDLFTNREETRHSNGTVIGSYFILHPDLTARQVNYVADETGFHVKVISKENGVKPVNTADAIFEYDNTDYSPEREDNGNENDLPMSEDIRPSAEINEENISSSSIDNDNSDDYSEEP